MLSKELIQKRELELKNSIDFKFPERLSRPHYLIIQLKKHLKAEKPETWQNPGMVRSRKNLSVNTTKARSNRAVLFMDTLIKLLENRGHIIKVVDFTTRIIIDGIEIDIALREVYKVVKQPLGHNSRELAPTGKLCFKLDEIWGREWYDGAKTIEDQIFNILATLEIYAETEIERNKKYAEQRRLREIEEAKQRELQRIRDNEWSRFNNIFSNIERWKKAQMIREFLNTASDSLSEEECEWISKKADWIDPLVNREDDILGFYESNL
ncbi:MAG: hypothetical protein ABJG41_14595 [Cyclobacteriaceae bacterium]